MEIPAATAHFINIGFSVFILLMMFLFGLYKKQNLGWVIFCFLWGGMGYFGVEKVIEILYNIWGNWQLNSFIAAILQQALVMLSVIAGLYLNRANSFVNPTAYGWATGLGYSFGLNMWYFSHYDFTVVYFLAYLFSTPVVITTASAISGLSITQFYTRKRSNQMILPILGIITALGYLQTFNWLYYSYGLTEFYPVVSVIYGIGGLTIFSLFIAGKLRTIMTQLDVERKRADSLLDIVIPIGIKLSSENDYPKLLETMLMEAKTFCNADGGTLYLKRDNHLEFAVVRNDSRKIAMGGTSGQEAGLPTIPLLDESGRESHRHVAAHAAWTKKTVNIADITKDEEFDYSGTTEFDKQSGYVSQSMLTIPLIDSKGETQGVLQLLNAMDAGREQIIAFDNNIQQLMESFSALASTALERYAQEQKLRNQIQELHIEIDQVKREKQVAEITDSDYFKELQQKAKRVRGQEEKNDAEV
ncbi:MAG TPA: GAF domain-containing protein [Anaerolineales bacterium]|nr:GAF domain-containing protein [Anaerolineales bacterium]